MIASQRWIAAGLFDPAVREKAGLRWTPSDEVLLRLFGKMVEVLAGRPTTRAGPTACGVTSCAITVYAEFLTTRIESS